MSRKAKVQKEYFIFLFKVTLLVISRDGIRTQVWQALKAVVFVPHKTVFYSCDDLGMVENDLFNFLNLL